MVAILIPDDSVDREIVELIGSSVNHHADATLRTITGIKVWLLGQDSNLEPSGYKRPEISSGLGLSHRPFRRSGLRASGASPESDSGYELAL
jgi:hypothetical protein